MSLNRYIDRSNDAESSRVNIGDDDEFILEGFVPSLVRYTIFLLTSFVSGGILFIFFSWRPAFKTRLINQRCSLENAQLIVLRDKHGKEFVENVFVLQKNQSFILRYFYHKKLKYIWKNEYKHFEKIRGLESQRCSVIYSQVEGATSTEASLKLELYGHNSIVIDVLPIWKLVLDEATGPFYLYQFFICFIWIVQLYYQFATCILLLSIISVLTHVWQTRKQSILLKEQVQSESKVWVLRDGSPKEICSTELIPGDVLILPKHSFNLLMECDAVLISGSCIVDESMLTGESQPVPKVALVENSNSLYSPNAHKSNTLFSGTRLLSLPNCKDDVKAVVVRTGFSTTKGELAHSILFPLQANNNLKKQLIKMSAIFFMIGLPCMAYTVYALSRFSYANHDIFIIVLDVATFLIPPVLPAVLTSINIHAQRRLRTKDIYCLNSRMISCSGEVDVMCFDKTGTLTEDSIDFAGVVTNSNCNDDEQFGTLVTNVSSLHDDRIVKAMAACHSIIQYKDNLEGDDIDLKLFIATGWKFVPELKMSNYVTDENAPERIVTHTIGTTRQTISILKQYPFESFLQRMSVIVKDINLNCHFAIVKGAPEIIASFCSKNTIPENFFQIFESYSGQGFRVLAAAIKVLPDAEQQCFDMSRSDIECEMHFIGLYLFKNMLKPATFDALQELSRSKIRCIMSTGDSLLTALSVAEECELVEKSDAIIKVQATTDKSNSLRVHYSYAKYPGLASFNDNNANLETANCARLGYHLAIDGDSFNTIKNADLCLLERIVAKGAIFARMSPDQKLNLINMLQKQNHNVGMCGDGANDCGALRAADAGISLSVAEASVASPFTYKQKDITCVPALLKEGRCTLVAIFGAFKYQVCYCFILLGSVLILFWYGTKPSEGTYIYVDILLNILPPMLFGTTKPYNKLVQTKPIRNVLSLVPQVSMYSFILLQVSIYYYISQCLISNPWYQPMKPNMKNLNDPPTNHLANAIFSANMMSYVISAIIFAPGPPYREHFFSNKKYIAVVVLNFLLILSATLVAPSFLLDFLKFQDMPFEFRFQIFIISIVNFAISFVLEKYLLDHILRRSVKRLKKKLKIKSSKRFKVIERDIEREEWPFNNMATADAMTSGNANHHGETPAKSLTNRANAKSEGKLGTISK